MECLNCKITNETDSRFCRKCGVSLRKCATCAVELEADALYCRRCGKSTKQLQENRAAAHETQEQVTASFTDSDGDVDFTTKIAPKRVEPLHGAGGRRHPMRIALYVVAVLLAATALTAVVTMRRDAGASSAEAGAQAETLRADLEEFKKVITETKDADRKAILQEIGLVLARMKSDERRTTREEIRKAIAGAKEDERKVINEEITKAVATAVAKAREKDHGFIIAELTKLKAKTKNREFTRQIERTIALFRARTKPVIDTRRGHDG